MLTYTHTHTAVQCACLLPILSHSQMHHRIRNICRFLSFLTDTYWYNGMTLIVRSEFTGIKWIENLILHYSLATVYSEIETIVWFQWFAYLFFFSASLYDFPPNHWFLGVNWLISTDYFMPESISICMQIHLVSI